MKLRQWQVYYFENQEVIIKEEFKQLETGIP